MKTRFIFVGGFLGAGKTSLLWRRHDPRASDVTPLAWRCLCPGRPRPTHRYRRVV